MSISHLYFIVSIEHVLPSIWHDVTFIVDSNINITTSFHFPIRAVHCQFICLILNKNKQTNYREPFLYKCDISFFKLIEVWFHMLLKQLMYTLHDITCIIWFLWMDTYLSLVDNNWFFVRVNYTMPHLFVVTFLIITILLNDCSTLVEC